MAFVKFHGESVPLEMHKVRIVQKLTLLPVDERLGCVTAAGNNTFLLQNPDVFLDMLTDSGTNAGYVTEMALCASSGGVRRERRPHLLLHQHWKWATPLASSPGRRSSTAHQAPSLSYRPTSSRTWPSTSGST